MGVGISNWRLAGAVAREGAVGTLSSVGHGVTPAYKSIFNEMIRARKLASGGKLSEEEFNQVFFDVNLACIAEEVRRAKEVSE